MISVNTKHELSDVADQVVHIKSIDAIYIRNGDDWIEKKYFSALEVGKEIGETPVIVRAWAIKMFGKRAPFRFTIQEIRTLVEVKKRRGLGQSFRQIKEACKL